MKRGKQNKVRRFSHKDKNVIKYKSAEVCKTREYIIERTKAKKVANRRDVSNQEFLNCRHASISVMRRSN